MTINLDDQMRKVESIEYGGQAFKLALQDDTPGARGALQLYATNPDIREMLGDYADYFNEFINTSLSDDKQVKEVATALGKKQQSLMKPLKIKDLRDRRWQSILEAYVSDDTVKGEVEATFERFKDIEYGEIIEKYTQAKEVAESNSGIFSDDQKNAARVELARYDPIVHAIELVERGIQIDNYKAIQKKALALDFESYANTRRQTAEAIQLAMAA